MFGKQSTPKAPGFFGRLWRMPKDHFAESVRGLNTAVKDTWRTSAALGGITTPRETAKAVYAEIDRTPSATFEEFCRAGGLAEADIPKKEQVLWISQAAMFVLLSGFLAYSGYLIYRGWVFSAALTVLLALGTLVRALRFGWQRVILRERCVVSLRVAVSKGALWPV